MKKLLVIAVVIIALFGFTVPVWANENTVETTVSEDYIPSEEIEVVEIETFIIYKSTKEMMAEQKLIMEKAHLQAEELRAQGYTDDSVEIQKLKTAYMTAHNLYLMYQKEYRDSDEFWAEKEAENPTGTYIWKYLKNLGYSDAVCAGIFGNMMLECGIDEVGSFDLKWWVYDGSQWFYGLCQWSKTYFPEVYGMDLEFQMDYLRDTIKEQIDEAGFCYGGDGFGYEEFLQLEDPAEVAVCFAKAYERCASQHVWPRRGFAEQAYEYFTN